MKYFHRCSQPELPCASGSLWDPVNCVCVSTDPISYSQTSKCVGKWEITISAFNGVLMGKTALKVPKMCDNFCLPDHAGSDFIHLSIRECKFSPSQDSHMLLLVLLLFRQGSFFLSFQAVVQYRFIKFYTLIIMTFLFFLYFCKVANMARISNDKKGTDMSIHEEILIYITYLNPNPNPYLVCSFSPKLHQFLTKQKS